MRSADEVTIELPLAGPTSRMLAYAIDALTMGAAVCLLVALAFMVGTITWSGVRGWAAALFEWTETNLDGLGLAGLLIFALLLGLVAEILYFVLWEMLASGQSPGKRLLGLRVVRDGGLPITPWASLVRNVLRAVDQLPSGYATGLIAIVLSPQAKRLGDLAAGTVVTRLDHAAAPAALPAIAPERVAAVRLTNEQVARLDATAMRLARSTLRRLDSLDDVRRAEVIAVATDALGRRIGLTEPPHDSEAFLAAVVAAWAAHRR